LPAAALLESLKPCPFGLLSALKLFDGVGFGTASAVLVINIDELELIGFDGNLGFVWTRLF
jgi:hypothetical protein